jgi:galactitol-specific phosphotransferase system IIB component
MGQKSKAVQHGLTEIIAKQWDGGKNTIVFVTEKVNEYLKQNGLTLTVSREAVRHVIRSYEDKVNDLRKSVEQAKAMAEVLQDQPGTELSESLIMYLSRVLYDHAQTVESVNFEDPSEMFASAAKIATAQAKLSQYRTQAVKALDKAKEKIKAELQTAIKHDPDLLERLCKIVDNAKVA